MHRDTEAYALSHDNFRIKNEHALRKLMEAAEEHEISTQRPPQSTSSFGRLSGDLLNTALPC